MMLASSDVFTQLQPRHVCRRERKPGTRERHSALRQRHATDFGPSAGNIQKSSAESTNQRGKSYYSMDSAISEFSRNKGNKRNENTEQERVTSSYKDISTIDAIRASMKATASHKSAPPPHIPNWMLDLDINLNVSSVDLIPPFDKELNAPERDSETFNEAASLIFVDTDSDCSENDNAYNREIAEDLDTERRKHVNYKIEGDGVQSSRPHSRQNESVPSSRNGVRPMSNTFRIARGFSPTGKENESPRRYQGDKKVMSMQQGGIRSTPFQPKAKKFINQMITYRHMKHHDMKIKKAKPAIDTKMPATFKMALERKQLVEQRFSDSWSRASTSPTPTTSRSSLETKSSKRQSTQRSR